MHIKRYGYPGITITFKKKNGEIWEEHYSSYMLDIFKNDPEVFEIRYTDTGKIIYRRDTQFAVDLLANLLYNMNVNKRNEVF